MSSAQACRYTPTQGQYLAFIYAYTCVLARAPAEADLQRFFRVTPPSVHQMILTLEREGLIRQHRVTHPTRAAPGATSISTGQILCAEVLVESDFTEAQARG
jgi:DNA-binding MarR family transcriptional regulator